MSSVNSRRRHRATPRTSGPAISFAWPALATVFLVAGLLIAALIVSGGQAGDSPEPPVEGLTYMSDGVVSTVVDGDAVVLRDGRRVRLVGMQAPRLPLGRTGFEAWPLSSEARDGLEDLLLGHEIALFADETAEDRHGRILAHAVRLEDGLWVQGNRVGQGMARVYPFSDNTIATCALYREEAAARDAGRGLWSDPWYAVRTPETVEDDVDSFQVVVGEVVSTNDHRGRIFLNFFEDWRGRFSVSIAPDDRERFETAGLDPLTWAGETIEIRGWVRDVNGPTIDGTHPHVFQSVPGGVCDDS